MTVLRSSGHGRRHGVVGWWAGMWAPCSVVAHSGGGRLEPSVSVDAYSLVDDLGCRWVHAHVVVVPFVALREVAVHILEQLGLLWVERGPFNCLPVLDLGAAVFKRVGGGLRCGAAVFGQHREGIGLVFGVPRSPVEPAFRCSAGSPRYCGHVLRRSLFHVCV